MTPNRKKQTTQTGRFSAWAAIYHDKEAFFDMGSGNLRVSVVTAGGAIPIRGANVTVMDDEGRALFSFLTDPDGEGPSLPLEAPDAWHNQSPDAPPPYYFSYQVWVSAEGYHDVLVDKVIMLDGSQTLQTVQMHPLNAVGPGGAEVIHGGGHGMLDARGGVDPPSPSLPRVFAEVIIPDYITVHLAAPSVIAPNVRVPFREYVKNVASHEIFDNWPREALKANIYCIVSLALSRVYTEFYRIRGFHFDITNSTAIDQLYQPDGYIGGNISEVTDEIFNMYLAIPGHNEPFIAQYCDGRTVQCPGRLSQWGSMADAQQGMTAMEIIGKYFAPELELRESTNFASPIESYPGAPLREGGEGRDVLRMQQYLNRVSGNFPLIPVIRVVDGRFGAATTEAVRTFQQIFAMPQTGVIDKATWYRICYIYRAVISLSELYSQGQHVTVGRQPPTGLLRQGSRGREVAQLQFLLNLIAAYYAQVPFTPETGVFDAATRTAVLAFQEMAGVGADGLVGPITWRALYNYYWGIMDNVALPAPPPASVTHMVGAGESLFLLAQRYGTTVEALRAVNGLTSDVIFVGQTLRLPGAGVSVPAAGGVPGASGSGGSPAVMVVFAGEGETLEDIAQKHGTDAVRVARYNPSLCAQGPGTGGMVLVPT